MRDAPWFRVAAGGLLVLGCVALVLWFARDSEPVVTGTVLLDNEPLTTGSIAWIPMEGTPGPGGGAGINDGGRYEIKRGLRPGTYRVEIRSTRELTRKVKNPTVPSEFVFEEVSVIPEQYNTSSSLIREVGPGSNVLNFELQGAPATR